MARKQRGVGRAACDLEGGFQETRDDAETAFAGDRAQQAGDDRTITERERKGADAELSGGDVDAAWERGDVGEEGVGGTVATPDQDVVDELGEAVGLVYEEGEPLHSEEKLEERDRTRWELNPASSEDYEERARPGGAEGP